MPSCKLSILVASTYCREEMTERLLSRLREMSKGYDAEVVVCYDNKEMSIGTKRQKMIEEANGEYVCFIDSDDDVPTYYVKEIFAALDKHPDCIGFDIKTIGTKGVLASASNRYSKWEKRERSRRDIKKGKGKYDYYRTPYHKTPIRREIALEIGFKDLRYAEDHDFSQRLKQSGLIKTEEYIDRVMYIYKYKEEEFRKKYGYDRE